MPDYHSLLSFSTVLEVDIIERLNRFVVKVEKDGALLKAHINNTGRLEQFLTPGKRAFCLKSKGNGKTDCRLFAISDGEKGAIIDTQLQMKAFEKAREEKLLPWLRGYRFVKRNAPLGNSRIDYLLKDANSRLYLEVKSAVLRDGNWALYPDCPTLRGQKHIRELTAHAAAGGKACILFIAALPRIDGFKPYKTGDPKLYELLRAARAQGVVIRSLSLHYDPLNKSIDLYHSDLNIAL